MLQTALDEDASRSDVPYKRFRDIHYQEAEGPRALGNQIYHLYQQWLNPEKHTLEQMLNLVVLEQFMSILPQEMESWLKECRPETTCQAVALAEGFLLSKAAAEKQQKQLRKFYAKKSKGQKMGKVLSKEKEKLLLEPRQWHLFRESTQKGRGRTLAGYSKLDQGPTSFEDLDVYFSEEEWALLNPRQRALYREVTAENRRNLAFLCSSYPGGNQDWIKKEENREAEGKHVNQPRRPRKRVIAKKKRVIRRM